MSEKSPTAKTAGFVKMDFATGCHQCLFHGTKTLCFLKLMISTGAMAEPERECKGCRLPA